MEIQLENLEICKKCGGKCCKKSGCDYMPNDFEEMTFNYLFNKLSEGKISIVTTVKIEMLKNNKKILTPILYLRARNINRPIVDLLSLKTTCSQLSENGCNYSLEERPAGGVNLIPKENNKCYRLIDQLKIMESWDSYQNVLSRLVKRITGLSVDEKLKQDIENLMYDIMTENFKGVSEQELYEIRGLIPFLNEIYPDEVKKAYQRSKKDNYSKVKR